MRKTVLILLFISIVTWGYSQDTIVTAKKVYVGEITDTKNKFFTIRTGERSAILDSDYDNSYIWIPYKKVERLVTSNPEANQAFENYQMGDPNIETNSPYSIPSTETDLTEDTYSAEYNVALNAFNKFNAKRKGGIGAMIAGGAATVVGGVLMGVGAYTSIPQLTLSGYALSGVGSVSFLVGLFCWIDGQDKMFNAKNELNIIKLKRSIISGDISPAGAKISLSF